MNLRQILSPKRNAAPEGGAGISAKKVTVVAGSKVLATADRSGSEAKCRSFDIA
jgi:hypothetical protein